MPQGAHKTTTQQSQTQDTTLQHGRTLTNNKVTTHAHTHHWQRWQNKRGQTNTSKHITQSKWTKQLINLAKPSITPPSCLSTTHGNDSCAHGTDLDTRWIPGTLSLHKIWKWQLCTRNRSWHPLNSRNIVSPQDMKMIVVHTESDFNTHLIAGTPLLMLS